MHRIECCQNDAIIGRILGELSNYSNNPIQTSDNSSVVSYGPNFFNGIKLFGWALIPIFIIFIPIGLIPIFKQLKYPKYVLVLVPVILAIPIIYSVSIAPDTRYVYPLFPIFCVISLFGINWIGRNFRNEKLIVGLIFAGIIISSLIFLDLKKIDYSYDDEAHNISKLVIKDVEGVNQSTTLVGKYFKSSQIENRWPITEYNGKLSGTLKINLVDIKDFTSLEEFLKFGKNNGLSHLIIDNHESKSDLFINIFYNEEKYDYLIKEFDSHDHGYKYHVKKFKIDYDMFEK
tara:strand:- start:230 stop:1096 length:867 start_codon:yes stop_codon:yes gene_type:complete